MRRPRVRFTLRRMMAAVAIVAVELGLFANLGGGAMICFNLPFVWLAILHFFTPWGPNRE